MGHALWGFLGATEHVLRVMARPAVEHVLSVACERDRGGIGEEGGAGRGGEASYVSA